MNTRALVVYQHRLVGDVTAGILERAEVNVVAVIHSSELTIETLRALKPDVVVLEQATDKEALEHFDCPLASPQADTVSRVIRLRSTGSTLLISERRLVRDASVDRLIAETRGAG